MSKVSLNSNIADVALRYLEYCELEKNLSKNTIKMYHFYLTDFIDWMSSSRNGQKPKLSDIDVESVKNYRIYLNRRKSLKFHQEFKRSTQKTFLVSLRAFLKYLLVIEDLDMMSPDQILLGKDADRVPKVFNDDQLGRFFEVQDLNKKSGVRDRAILETLFSTGLRVSELVALNKDDVNLQAGDFTVVGKGGKARVVYLSPSAIGWLKRYLATRNDAFNPLFVRYSGKKMEEGDFDGDSLRLTPRSVQRLVKKYVRRAGISIDATPHTLRHTFATGLLREGADLRSVQELLGHSNVSTTQIYTHVTNAQLKDVHKKFHKDMDNNAPEVEIDDLHDNNKVSSLL